jgi:hypothetical protein
MIGIADSDSLDMLSHFSARTNLPSEIVDSMRTLRALLWLASDPKVGRRSPYTGTHTSSQAHSPEHSPNVFGTGSGTGTLYQDMLYSMRNLPAFRGNTQAHHAPAHATTGHGHSGSESRMLWGPNTPTIIRECQKLSSALSLPSLNVIFDNITLGNGGSNGYNDIVQQPFVLEGSFLPSATANKYCKPVSFISKKPIVGSWVEFPAAADVTAGVGNGTGSSSSMSSKDESMFASKNEMLQWKSILPYSPTLSGEFIDDIFNY